MITAVEDGVEPAVWPNLFTRELYVEAPEDGERLEIVNAVGETVAVIDLPLAGPWDGASLASGVYVGRVYRANGQVVTVRFAKR